MIYIYRRRNTTGGRELAEALGGRRVRNPNLIPLQPNDVVICWGEAAPRVPPGVRVINGTPLRNKYEDTRILSQAGVPTVTVSRTQPQQARVAPPAPVVDPAVGLWEEAATAATAFGDTAFGRTPVRVQAVTDLMTHFDRLRTALRNPPPVAGRPVAPPTPRQEWVGRNDNHTGGTDLLRGTGHDYWVRKENLTEEYRLHMFNGRSVRAGRKVPREGMTPHAWVRSYDGGWRIAYDGFESTATMRTLAANACEALGLEFGAVDLGRKANDDLIVLEVNRAPGLEGGTVTSYAAAISRMLEGQGRRMAADRRRR